MKQTEIIMGMPITVEITDSVSEVVFSDVFLYFKKVDARYSTYKKDSEITKINNGLPKDQWSTEMKNVLRLCQQTKVETHGYFNINHNGKVDPSGLVKGWSIHNAAQRLIKQKIKNFYIEAGGDVQVYGTNAAKETWTVGIRNPFNIQEVVKTISLTTEGVATSGTYIRGQHIYNPLHPDNVINDIKSLTVIGPNIYEADRYATAAFAMGKRGIDFIESLLGFEGYMVDSHKTATFTNGFERYVTHDA